MQNSAIFKRDLKIFGLSACCTGSFIVLFSFIGHALTPGKLIPSSFAGGTVGLVAGLYLCFRRNYVGRDEIFPVILCSLIAFGIAAFLSVFNLNHPFIVPGSFLSIGLIAVASNRYFARYSISKSKLYGTLGLILVFPVFYFVVASFLRFQLGNDSLFGVIESLLNRTHGQENFNAITPFLFGGGLLLAFGLNVFSQIEINHVIRIRVRALNLTALLLAGFTGLAMLVYLAFENLA